MSSVAEVPRSSEGAGVGSKSALSGAFEARVADVEEQGEQRNPGASDSSRPGGSKWSQAKWNEMKVVRAGGRSETRGCRVRRRLKSTMLEAMYHLGVGASFG